ncbi:ribonuclease T2-like protein [Obelidium mucronatum]|nr:ribonuclease T2-like protein [Obelidium mucronatum]
MAVSLSASVCPSYAIGCRNAENVPGPDKPDPIWVSLGVLVNNATYDECCVSNNIFVFAQNYTVGLSYKSPNFGWTKNEVVASIGNRFTIHGLWADHCDGSYEGTKWNADHTIKTSIDYDLVGCDVTHAFQNAADVILSNCNKAYLYDYMSANWVGGDGDNNWFWSHEWSKHGTCTGSFKDRCYDGSSKFQGFFDFLQVNIEVYTKLDMMDAFKKSGIVPSDSATYTLAGLNAAHKAAFGFEGGMQCVKNNGKQYLTEVWTYLTEAPGHKYNPVSPTIVPSPYQSCNGSLPIVFALTANKN